jgi:hypothetical protein
MDQAEATSAGNHPHFLAGQGVQKAHEGLLVLLIYDRSQA